MAAPWSNSGCVGSWIRSAWRVVGDCSTPTETATTYTIPAMTVQQESSNSKEAYKGSRTFSYAATGKTTQSGSRTWSINSTNWYEYDFNALTFNKTHSAQSITLTFTVKASNYYTYKTSGTPTDQGPYTDTGTATYTFTIPAKTNYSVTYNANGVGTAPAAQTKWYGESLTLQGAITNNEGWEFIGWNTAADGSGTSYAAGASYTGNAALTLYAQWKESVGSVTIGSASAIRVENASSTTEYDEGTYAYITVPISVNGRSACTATMTITARAEGGGTAPTVTYVTRTLTKSSSGSTPLTGTFIARASGCALDKKYIFTISVEAVNSADQTDIASSTRTQILPTAFYTMDVLAGGHGISFGAPCNDDGFHVHMPSDFNDRVDVLDSVVLHHPVIERGIVPSSSIYGGDGTLRLADKNGNQIGYLQPMQLSDGTEGIQLGVSNSDNTDWNTVQLAFDANDNPTVSMSDADKWRNALGITDSGWQTLTLGSAAKAYDSGTAPVYRKCFNVVNLVGAVSPKSQVAAGGEFDVGVLPDGYRPKVAASTVCQGSGNSVYLLRIGTNGNIRVERYRNGASANAAISTTTWLPFNVTFICA